MIASGRLRRVVFAVLGPTVLLAGSADAGPNANAKIMIHLSRIDKVLVCTSKVLLRPCDQLSVTAQWGTPAQVFYHSGLLITDAVAAAGVAALEVGIEYPDEVYVGFFACGLIESSTPGPNGGWPMSGSSAVLRWDTTGPGCQVYEPGGAGTGVVAIAGSFYITPYFENSTPPVTIRMIPAPTSGVARVWSCAGVVDTVEGGGYFYEPSHLGRAGISNDGSQVGHNPCGLPIPVVATTWSRMKTLRR